MVAIFYKKISKYILKWTIISFFLGLINALIVMLIQRGISKLDILIYSNYLLAPVLGGVLVGIIIYYLEPRAAGLGTNMYINYTKNDLEIKNSFKLIISKIIATEVTLGLIGVGGLVGPLLLIGSGIALFFKQLLNFFKINLINFELEFRVLSVCGAASALGALLGAPIGGGIFSSEVLYRSSVNYNDLFPAILGSSFGYFFYQNFTSYQQPKLNLNVTSLQMKEIIILIIVALICGLIGQIFISVFRLIDNKFNNLNIPQLYHPMIAGIIIVIFRMISKINLISDIKEVNTLLSNLFSVKVLIFCLLARILMTTIVISSGGSAAVVDTALISGALAGNLLHHIFPQISLYILVIVGLSATLASIANVPLATMILVIETFNISISLPVVIGSIIGFLIGRPRIVFKYIKV